MKKLLALFIIFNLIFSFNVFANENDYTKNEKTEYAESTISLSGYKCYSLSCAVQCVYWTYDPTWYEEIRLQNFLNRLLCPVEELEELPVP